MSAGEAEAIYRRADATAKGISLVSQAVTAHGGSEAASLRVAEQVCMPFWNTPAEKALLVLFPVCWPGKPNIAVLLSWYIGRTLAFGGQCAKHSDLGKHASVTAQASTECPDDWKTQTI